MKTKNILILIVAAGLTSFAANAKAAVIYNRTTFSTTNSVGIYFDGSTLSVTDGGYSGWSLQNHQAFNDGPFDNYPAEVGFGNSRYTYDYTSELSNYSIVGSNLSFGNFPSLSNSVTDKIYGLRWNSESSYGANDGNLYYGWMNISYNQSSGTLTFLGAAMNTAPNTPITVEATGAIPEPSTYGLIGLGALGVAFAARRRKAKVA
jgi:hypothetical protein